MLTMGTSASSSGSPGGSPLVPPWADIDNEGPGPEPRPQRFRAFRTILGRFVASGDAALGRAALGRFVSSGLGGSTTAVRRFAPAISAAGRLSDLIADLSVGGTGERIVGFDLSALRGEDVGYVIERIVNALCPAGTVDDEATRTSLDEALSAVLSDQPTFDPDKVSLEMLEELIVKFCETEIYLKVVAESGDAFDKTNDATVLMRRELELRELVRVVVDTEGRSSVSAGLKSFNKASFERIIRDGFMKALSAFEEYVE